MGTLRAHRQERCMVIAMTVVLAIPRLFVPAAGIARIMDIAAIFMPLSKPKDCRPICTQTYQWLRVAKLF